MNKLIKFSTLWITILALLVAVGSQMVSAAPAPASSNPANNGQALEIAPPVIYLSVNPGQTITTPIYIRDISSGNLIVAGQANDFVAAGEDGTPKVILNTNDTSDPYSLRTWVVAPTSLLLIPREIKTMSITINVPANASPGGHYGVIRFTATPPALQGTGVSLSASLGVLVLLTVSGKITENLSVQEFSVNHNGKTGSFFESGPLDFVERLKNNGNVHEQPIGQVGITDMFGKKFAAVNVNLPPGNILPDSIRKFDQPLDSSVIGNKHMFGRYTAKLDVTYGANKKTLAATLVFWVIPYKLIGIVILVLVAGFFILRYLIRRYNRYILNQSQKNRRK
jgi:hypothetical protein